MVADTYTSRIGCVLQGTGNNHNSWGTTLNAGLQVLDDAIAGNLDSAVTGGTLDLSGTPPPAAPSQARYSTLRFTGTLLSDQTVVLPNLHKIWLIANSTSGSFALLFKTTSGTAVDVPQGTFKFLVCNGSNGINRTDLYEVGEIKFVARASVPPGYVECDGTTRTRARDVSLFGAIGTTWGVGDGVTTFNLPNLKDTGRFIRTRSGSTSAGTYQSNQNAAHTHTGSVSSTGTSGGASADHTHNYSGTTGNDSPDHAHLITSPASNQPASGAAGTSYASAGGAPPAAFASGGATARHTHTFSGTTTGRSADHTHSLSVSGSFTTASSGGTEARPDCAIMIAVIRL